VKTMISAIFLKTSGSSGRNKARVSLMKKTSLKTYIPTSPTNIEGKPSLFDRDQSFVSMLPTSNACLTGS
jgi:hypothetical protein